MPSLTCGNALFGSATAMVPSIAQNLFSYFSHCGRKIGQDLFDFWDVRVGVSANQRQSECIRGFDSRHG